MRGPPISKFGQARLFAQMAHGPPNYPPTAGKFPGNHLEASHAPTKTPAHPPINAKPQDRVAAHTPTRGNGKGQTNGKREPKFGAAAQSTSLQKNKIGPAEACQLLMAAAAFKFKCCGCPRRHFGTFFTRCQRKG